MNWNILEMNMPGPGQDGNWFVILIRLPDNGEKQVPYFRAATWNSDDCEFMNLDGHTIPGVKAWQPLADPRELWNKIEAPKAGKRKTVQ